MKFHALEYHPDERNARSNRFVPFFCFLPEGAALGWPSLPDRQHSWSIQQAQCVFRFPEWCP